MVGHLLDPLSRREQNSYQVLFFCMNFHLTITPNVPRPREDPIDHGVCRSHESQVRLRQLPQEHGLKVHQVRGEGLLQKGRQTGGMRLCQWHRLVSG